MPLLAACPVVDEEEVAAPEPAGVVVPAPEVSFPAPAEPLVPALEVVDVELEAAEDEALAPEEVGEENTSAGSCIVICLCTGATA